MDFRLLNSFEIEEYTRRPVKIGGGYFLCSAADFYLALERIRKDNSTTEIRAEFLTETNNFQCLCRSGCVTFLTLSNAALIDGPFTDPYDENLSLDKNVFSRETSPEDSIRLLNLKEIYAWGWNVT